MTLDVINQNFRYCCWTLENYDHIWDGYL